MFERVVAWIYLMLLHLLLCAILASLLAKLESSSSFKQILKLGLPAHYLLSQFYIDNGDTTCKEFQISKPLVSA